MSDSQLSDTDPTENDSQDGPWYAGVTRYQWLVLAIASAGWVFDVFEGQLFAVYKTPAMADILQVAETDPLVDQFSNYALAAFMIGGAFGGLVFGMLADRIGRRRSMIYSILVYSFFTGMHYFATSAWVIVGLRFFVAMGVGGEWAIAAALVSEVFPKRARAIAGGIFHASSVLGAVLASLCGMFLALSNWRIAFLIGLVPALLILWIRSSLKESERWEESQSTTDSTDKKPGMMSSLPALLGDRRWAGRAFLGLALASIGMGTYWGVYAWGPELATDVQKREAATLSGQELQTHVKDVIAEFVPTSVNKVKLFQLAAHEIALEAGLDDKGKPLDSAESVSDRVIEKRDLARHQIALLVETQELESDSNGTANQQLTTKYREILKSGIARRLYSRNSNFAYLIMNFTGGLLGLLAFAPLASIAGRRPAFAFYHLGALIMAPATFYFASSLNETIILLSVMAFFVVGMHAGYAIYFPELFPTRLRATGASFCFNVGRLVAASILIGRVYLRESFTATYGASLGLRYAVSTLALLFAVGLVLLIFAPETNKQELPE